MPKFLRDEIKVHIIQSRDHILNTYAEKISEYTEVRIRARPSEGVRAPDADASRLQERFRRNEIDMILNARVKEVKPDEVVYTVKDPATGSTTEHVVDSGFTLWSTGIGALGRLLRSRGDEVYWADSLASCFLRTAMNPFTQRVASLLPNQYHKHALEVDSHLRVLGAPLGTVYALGDCATIETRLVDHLLEFVERCDDNHDGNIDRREFEKMLGVCRRSEVSRQSGRFG